MKKIMFILLMFPMIVFSQVGILGLNGTDYVKTPIKYHISEDSTVFTGDVTTHGLIKANMGVLCGAPSSYVSPYRLDVFGTSIFHSYIISKYVNNLNDSLIINQVGSLAQIVTTTDLSIIANKSISINADTVVISNDMNVTENLDVTGNLDCNNKVSISDANLTFGGVITIDNTLDAKELFKLQLQDTSQSVYKVANSVVVNSADSTLYIYLGKWKKL